MMEKIFMSVSPYLLRDQIIFKLILVVMIRMKCNSKLLANQRKKIRRADSTFNNSGLDRQEKTAEKFERIRLPSICGGTSRC
jgi:hypothetical protein